MATEREIIGELKKRAARQSEQIDELKKEMRGEIHEILSKIFGDDRDTLQKRAPLKKEFDLSCFDQKVTTVSAKQDGATIVADLLNSGNVFDRTEVILNETTRQQFSVDSMAYYKAQWRNLVKDDSYPDSAKAELLVKLLDSEKNENERQALSAELFKIRMRYSQETKDDSPSFIGASNSQHKKGSNR
jgi:hypothetical protein